MYRVANHGPNAAMAGVKTIQARARQVARNDPWGVAVIAKSVSNGIGCGIQRKGIWGDSEFKAQAKSLWNRWTKYADADCVVDWYGLQALAWREWREAGEVFIRLRSRRLSDGFPVPLQVQIIESEQCPSSYFATAPSGNVIRAGIEFNAIGKRVAYWMYSAHPGDGVYSQIDGNQLRRIPAEQIRHLYRPLRAGQHRGVPDSASVLIEMFNRATLDDNVMERQKLANLFGVFYTRPAGSEYGNVIGDMTTGTDGDGAPIAGLEPGMAQELPPGYKPEFANPPAPSDDYNEFQRQRLMAIAAAHGVPYEVLTGDLRGISDRALKLILHEFHRMLECDQWLYMIPQMCQPVAEAWTDAAVLSGLLDVPGYAEIRDQVTESLWVPQGWPYSHPVQDVSANIAAIRAGLGSRTGSILKNGDDPETIDAEQVADNARADELGLSYDSDGRRSQSAPEPEHDEEPMPAPALAQAPAPPIAAAKPDPAIAQMRASVDAMTAAIIAQKPQESHVTIAEGAIRLTVEAPAPMPAPNVNVTVDAKRGTVVREVVASDLNGVPTKVIEREV